MHKNATVFTHVNVIEGTGKSLQSNQNMVVKEGIITGIYPEGVELPVNAIEVDFQGKYIMPAIVNTHGHLGIVKDTINSAVNYTPENIKHELLRYQRYGVGTLLSMGTEQPAIFPLRDQSRAGQLPGATIYSAIYGFGVKNAAPPIAMGMSHVYRPETVAQAIRQVDSLAVLKPDVIKMWVDDFWGAFPKMKPEIYTAIIKEAHAKGLRVAAHLYHLDDAKKMVDLGLDIIAHSIRDGEVDEALIHSMKKHNVIYIPTLSLDDFAFSFEKDPAFLNDPTFRAALEPGVFKIITGSAYRAKVAKDPKTPQEIIALQVAMRNLVKLQKAGIVIALGTDSGALPIRPQGFAEHFEMELFVEAGLTPLQAITSATYNGAKLLKIDNQYGSIQSGRKADFIVLDANPLVDITNTRSIHSVWKEGQKVSDGPLAGTPYAQADKEKVSVLAQIKILTGYEAEVKRAAEQIWISTRKEAGCETFLFHILKDDPTTIVFYEVFKSQQAFNDHRAADHTKKFIASLQGKVVGNGPSLTYLNSINEN